MPFYPFGPFSLQWRAPTPNPPIPNTPLPPNVKRIYIQTPSGPLELLQALPPSPTGSQSDKDDVNPLPPLFFAHGGFGSAAIWLPYLQAFAARGYRCYAASYRGHGASWYPGFWRMYCTGRASIAGDLRDAVKFVEGLEAEQRGKQGGVEVVLISHSAGAALSQYLLSKGEIKVRAFCVFAGVPGFGSYVPLSFSFAVLPYRRCPDICTLTPSWLYQHWAPTFLFHFIYRFFHPRYILATPAQIRSAFFTPSTTSATVSNFSPLLSPYESMLWPMQSLFKFVTGEDVLSSITGFWSGGKTREKVKPCLLILAAEYDVLCRPDILRNAAALYRAAFARMIESERVEGRGEMAGSAVEFEVVQGVAHHLQNHDDGEWQKGVEVLEKWLGRLGAD
ncbi:unnamed protein product [Periconia digitata]|uniref:AB hydrolase-1 domain-containing protein n=1 Tax=Periconia digitata TaxID=1303443 RepID=A0A9W4UUL2_9PLEO|nr:unnamed protein product [Periconia digitata]